ncbi:hypothetical protein A1OE_1438 [Candidatus Endolissoclinum faulkneri L2]|uniref:Uncharacterized protein n=1 Tax=Candidatus Endolissoclinum faulkneri L2 TaxID=1193729 RepID=K7YPY3_9PROT|nr:hypothetical protein A1OE_1438 [Candidatus Endolissoclinum faulkneri L2]
MKTFWVIFYLFVGIRTKIRNCILKHYKDFVRKSFKRNHRKIAIR